MGLIQSSRAWVDIEKPEAFGICDRCGFRYLRRDLVWQFDWRGNNISNLRILVCTATCNDEPQPQLRPILVGPDPIPVKDPRPGWYATQMGYTVAEAPLELVSDDPPGYPQPPQPPVPPPVIPTLLNFSGFLAIANSNYPTDSFGLRGGMLYSPSGSVQSYIYVVPNFVYEVGPAVFFGSITAADLLSLGAYELPMTDPLTLNQIWNDMGVLAISAGSPAPPQQPLYDSSGNVLTDSSGNPLYGSS